ncbi:peroxiredoxin family protein [Aureliella helgolandensis]|uniref:Thiol-disulfide oxidoreductase ResA n=1 Tax=Aureliella helgolandensis TaxID=2527968 RepID=A0A518G0X3_9BACT|nr:TlpA disulfide reductase family protein [Aureliella helgolandensis]QDV22249.1 Thiol-disulfide oxidoreductase ResA [Aureliella helgolandensis]
MKASQIKFILVSIFYLPIGTQCWAQDQKTTSNEPKTLKVGSTAPHIDAEFCFRKNEVNSLKIEQYNRDTIYVVEFWATWCPPCIAAMPLMEDIQNEFADRGVQLISLSNESREKLDEFLAKEVPGISGKTYLDIAEVYAIACDPDQSVYKEYMAASGNFSIPKIFIIGKDGRVEWIGEHGGLRSTLEEILTGRWDRAGFARKYEVKQDVSLAIRRMSEFRQKHAEDPDVVIAEIDKELAKIGPVDEPLIQILRGFRIQTLVNCGRFDEADRSIREGFTNASGNLEAVGILASILPQLPEIEKIDRKSIVELAVSELENASPTETLSHAMQELNISMESQLKLQEARLYVWAGLVRRAEEAAELARRLAVGTSTESIAEAYFQEVQKIRDNREAGR